ncbi:hypothetical protein M758_4G196100 [Ceratodon purpureus]|nr:hypothetical protein M758_4G196100 [Ceratodon purpureus]
MRITRAAGTRRSPTRGRRGRLASRSRSKSRSRAKLKNTAISADDLPSCHRRGWVDRIVDYDTNFSYWIHEQGLQFFFYMVLRILEFSGEGLFLIPAAAAAYLLPKGKLNPEVRMFFFNLLGAFIVDLVIVTLIKNYVRRRGPMYCHVHHVTGEDRSFPSGHSTRALMVVTFFTMYLPMWRVQAANVWLPFLKRVLSNEVRILDEGVPMLESFLVSVVTWLVFSWAVATTSSRIILGRHFFFDVLVGCLVGTLESILYNNFLVIPHAVSEAVHSYISSFFGNIEEVLAKFFGGASMYIQSWVMR